MKQFFNISASLLLCATLALPTTSFASYDKGDAEYYCKEKIKHDNRYSGFSDITVQDHGHFSYTVRGLVRSKRGHDDHSFNCRIRHGEVVSWNVSPVAEISSDSSDGKTAAIIGAGVLGAIAIAAIASQDHDKDHASQQESYYSGSGGNPLDDMQFLKKQCKQEIRRHLRHDKGKLRALELTNVHLDRRELRGDGRVSFDRGGYRELSFTCDFDRFGRIHDGNYHFFGGMGNGSTGVGTSIEYKRGYNDGMKGYEFDQDRHPQDYKDGFRAGEKARKGGY